jgi:hypothetical protein
MLRKILFICSIFSFVFIHSSLHANDLRVFYAGFAFIGDNVNIEKNYPYSFSISQKLDMEVVLRTMVSRQKINNFNLIISELGNLDKGEGIAVAFALDNETVAIEQLGSYYKILIDLGAQALFFDFNGMKVIGSYPIAIQLIDVSESKPDDILIRERIRELFVGNKYNINIFNEFAKRLKNIKIKPKFKNSIQITNVTVEEKASAFLPEVYQNNLNNCRTFLAQNFTKFLSNNQDISVLPYTKGYAIGNKMVARFSNGKIYNLEIPEAQYEIDLTLRGFKKVKYDETKSATSWIYGAYINLKLFQPLLNKIYIDEKIKNGATKIVPIVQKNVCDWPAFQESLFVLFDKLTKEFSTEKKYESIKNILARCK